MTKEEQREQAVQNIADMMRTSPFSVEFRVKKKPTGIKVIIEVTDEQMDVITQNRKDVD